MREKKRLLSSRFGPAGVKRTRKKRLKQQKRKQHSDRQDDGKINTKKTVTVRKRKGLRSDGIKQRKRRLGSDWVI